jgi:hypothetical protein
MKPAVRYSGRLAADPAGQITQGEGTIIQGGGAQGAGLNRWGDYSAMTVDPVDDCTFWFTSEYLKADGTFNWSTRIASFKFPNCGGAPPTDDFSLKVSPSSETIAAGKSGTFTISTAVVSGSPQTITLAVTGLPAGVHATFNPTSVTTGASSTLTLAVDANASSSTSTLNIAGTSPTATHAVNPSLTVTGAPPPPPGLIVNGDFEKGDLSGWSTVTPVSVVSTGAHAGKFAAQVGKTTAFNGTASLAQKIHVPPKGTTTLTFFFNPNCNGAIRLDFQDAQIRDTNGKVLKSIFHICSNTKTWTKSTTDLTPFKGKDVSIFFDDHDDNGPADPTWLLIDDVAVTNH